MPKINTPALHPSFSSSITSLGDKKSDLPERKEISHHTLRARTGPSTYEHQGTVGNLTSQALRKITQVQEKKIQVQQIAKLWEHARKAKIQGNDIHKYIEQSAFAPRQDGNIAQRFAEGHPALIRTLRFYKDNEATKEFGASGKTPAKREVDTLTNRITGRDIVMTPASAIVSGAKANTISLMKKPDRPKWKGLPSIVSMPENRTPPSLFGQISKRPGFGDVHSFKSNEGFDAEYARKSASMSHSQKLEMLERKVKKYIKTDPHRQNSDFSHSIEELVQNMQIFQSKQPESILRHNEYCAKLEVWDARALEVGNSPSVAIATLLEFNLEMAALARDLEQEGPEGKNLIDFLKRQVSWTESGQVQDLASSLESLKLISKEMREAVLADITSNLRKGISLCTYEFQEEGSAIRALSLRDFKASEILTGLELFLSSKMQHLPTRSHFLSRL